MVLLAMFWIESGTISIYDSYYLYFVSSWISITLLYNLWVCPKEGIEIVLRLTLYTFRRNLFSLLMKDARNGAYTFFPYSRNYARESNKDKSIQIQSWWRKWIVTISDETNKFHLVLSIHKISSFELMKKLTNLISSLII